MLRENPFSLADDLSVYEDDRGPYLTRRQAHRAAQMQRKLRHHRFNPYGYIAQPRLDPNGLFYTNAFPYETDNDAVDAGVSEIARMKRLGHVYGPYDLIVTAPPKRKRGGRNLIRKIRQVRVSNPRRKRRWIGRAIKRPGALRNKFARWYGLKKGQKISPSMYARGYTRAKKRGDTRTMRQINLARSLSRLRRRKKSRRRGRVIRGVSFRPAARRRVANPRRKRGKNGRFVKSRKRRR